MDPQGFVWIMEKDRVQRFDGRNIKDFMVESELFSIACDDDGRVWVTSYSKVYLFADDHKGFISIPAEGSSSPEFYQVYNLHEKGVWVLTDNGFYIYDPAKNIFKKHPDPKLSALNHIAGRGIDDGRKTNTLYFQVADSLEAYQLTTGLFLKTLPVDNVRKINALSDSLVLVSTWSGILYLYNFSSGKIKLLDMSKYLSHVQDYFINVFQALKVSNEKYMLATNKGLLEYNIITGNFRQMKLFHNGTPLEGSLAFNDIYFDQHGSAWIVYSNYGLINFKLSAGEIGLVRNYETDFSKAWDNNVRNFAEDEKGNLWLATVNGFAKWNLQDGTIQPYFAQTGATDRLNFNSIRGITYDGINLILGPTDKGIWLYNPHTDKYARPFYSHDALGETTRKYVENDFIDQIITLRDGNHLVVARDGVYVIDAKTYTTHEIKMPEIVDGNKFCYQDSKENIWIGTSYALFCLDMHFNQKFRIDVNQTKGIVFTLCELNDGNLLAGGFGLHLINMSTPNPAVSDINSFFNKIDIHILFRDANNKIWLATSEGVFRYDMDEQKIESFSHFENIEGNAFYPNSYCYSKQGMLFLGSSKGIIYFNPLKMEETKDSLNIFISKMAINADDSTYSVTNPPGAMKYNQNNIAFDFIAPYYGNANKLKYRYRLQGLNNDWTSNGNNNSVRFHALQPGRYIFQASASINGIDWMDSKEKIFLSISPPFWMTWWFFTLMASCVAGVIYAIYRYQLNKKIEVERLRMRIARDLHDDIGSALSNIHIISSMAMKQQSDNGNAGKVFGKIKESSKAMLENMQDIVWAINPENDTLSQVLARMKEFAGELCEAAGIDYVFETDGDLETVKLTVHKRKDLYLVFKEALNNAVKYSSCKMIRISLHKQQDGWLNLGIEDNGKGFVQNEIQPGNGLRNMAQRAKEVNGNVNILSGPGQGTKVDFRIRIT